MEHGWQQQQYYRDNYKILVYSNPSLIRPSLPSERTPLPSRCLRLLQHIVLVCVSKVNNQLPPSCCSQSLQSRGERRTSDRHQALVGSSSTSPPKEPRCHYQQSAHRRRRHTNRKNRSLDWGLLRVAPGAEIQVTTLCEGGGGGGSGDGGKGGNGGKGGKGGNGRGTRSNSVKLPSFPGVTQFVLPESPFNSAGYGTAPGASPRPPQPAASPWRTSRPPTRTMPRPSVQGGHSHRHLHSHDHQLQQRGPPAQARPLSAPLP